MSNYIVDSADLTSVANAIRTKGGTSASLSFPADFVSAIAAIPSGGGTDLLSELCNGTLTDFDDDNITALTSQNLLRGNQTVTRIFLKNCVSIKAGYTLAGKKIETCVLPSLENATSAAGYTFADESTLTAVDLGQAFASGSNKIPSSFFASATGLNILVLRKTSGIVPLNNINAFNNTPFASGKSGGTLYVPSSLISSYQGASNWSTILGYTNNQIKSIESTHTDPTAPIDLTLYYADGTLIPT